MSECGSLAWMSGALALKPSCAAFQGAGIESRVQTQTRQRLQQCGQCPLSCAYFWLYLFSGEMFFNSEWTPSFSHHVYKIRPLPLMNDLCQKGKGWDSEAPGP